VIEADGTVSRELDLTTSPVVTNLRPTVILEVSSDRPLGATGLYATLYSER
jgi:hypothetical protein